MDCIGLDSYIHIWELGTRQMCIWNGHSMTGNEDLTVIQDGDVRQLGLAYGMNYR